jgi:hypothetical protein
MPRLYRAVDAFVLPTRGEGWGRPLMEAMAAGLPTIATAWSGVTAYHNAQVGYPLKFRLVPVRPAHMRELPHCAGQRWAEPSVADLRRLMRWVVNHPEEALAKGQAAQAAIAGQFSRAAVASLLRQELAFCRALAARSPAPASGLPSPGGPACSGVSRNIDGARMNWEQAPQFGRRATVLRTLRTLDRVCPGAACIVESGTLRDASPQARNSDGWSTIAWGWYSAQTGGKLYTIDIDPRNLAVCRQMTAPYASAIEYVVADSLQFLRQWDRRQRGAIHLLYLDGPDPEAGPQGESEEHHRAAAEAALPSLAPRCLVLLDDTIPAGTLPGGVARFAGKGALAIPLLLAHGFTIEWAEARQVLLSRRAPGGRCCDRTT